VRGVDGATGAGREVSVTRAETHPTKDLTQPRCLVHAHLQQLRRQHPTPQVLGTVLHPQLVGCHAALVAARAVNSDAL
jgi:hypothetical protein